MTWREFSTSKALFCVFEKSTLKSRTFSSPVTILRPTLTTAYTNSLPGLMCCNFAPLTSILILPSPMGRQTRTRPSADPVARTGFRGSVAQARLLEETKTEDSLHGARQAHRIVQKKSL